MSEIYNHYINKEEGVNINIQVLALWQKARINWSKLLTLFQLSIVRSQYDLKQINKHSLMQN
jgi:hypothetical protein